ncbi:MAG: argininosuccinate synthase [Firmicutes bacterium]|jgi:argininosuccinate synthase|nr:argininosuccinate synthase [Bacillota bacterium]
MKREKVVVAYSGGLDTSVILKWLEEHYGYDAVAVAVDVGQGSAELEGLVEKALRTGAAEAYIEDVREEFVTDFIYPMLRSGAVYEGKYLLGTAIARPVIARKLAEVARRVGATAVAHGATGKGNDQVRFELTLKALAPHLKIIAPWREWTIRSRSDALAYAAAHEIPVPVTAAKPYSMDRNLWHLSFEGGVLEDPWNEPDGEMFLLTCSPQEAPDEPCTVEIEWEKGIPVSVNGRRETPVAMIEGLNELAGRHGIGRADLVENRLVGMKSRGVYETPAGTLLTFAHRELEHLCIDRDTLHFKEHLALKYAELIYYGQWYSPLREALDAFFNFTQERVSGTVKLKLYKGNIMVVGRKSPHTLYNPELATFEEDSLYDQKDAEGFINLFGLPLKIWGMHREKEE